MGKPSQHIPTNEKGVHKSSGNKDAGACLLHNVSRYQADSCSYRWQGKEEPRKPHQKVYKNYPTDKAGRAKRGIKGATIKTMQRTSAESGNLVPAAVYYDATLDAPGPGDWDLDGPGAASQSPSAKPNKAWKTIPKGENFTTAYWPYWNNAHHIIPKAMLKDVIMAIGDKDVRALVIVGLQKALYNVNQYKNVIFLPMDEEVGMMLRLPRHLTLDGSSSVADPQPFANHIEYTALVQKGLQPIIDDLADKADDARAGKKLCQAKKDIKLSKIKLENHSEKCWKAIVDFGKTKAGAGAPIVDMPPIK